tara:strand:+ start:410 stop:733 length:324 start_codon:yes stop_codon:yes gene_type:complete
MIVEAKKLPYKEHNEESIFLSNFTVRRRYKKTKKAKTWEHEEMKLKESFVHKGISPEVVLRRRGMLDRLRKKTEWNRGIIEIIKIDFLVYTGKGCVEELIDISKENI